MELFLAFKGTRPLSLRYTNGGHTRNLSGRGFSLGTEGSVIMLRIDMTHNLRKRDKSTTIAADAHRLSVHAYPKLTTLCIDQAAALMSKFDRELAKAGDAPELHLTLLLDQPRTYLATHSERNDSLVLSITKLLESDPPPADADDTDPDADVAATDTDTATDA